MPQTNHLRRHRRQWALTQTQLAGLVGVRTRSVVSSHERDEHPPALRVAIAYEHLFDISMTELFPTIREHVEEELMRAAARLDAHDRHRSDPDAKRRQELLAGLAARTASSKTV